MTDIRKNRILSVQLSIDSEYFKRLETHSKNVQSSSNKLQSSFQSDTIANIPVIQSKMFFDRAQDLYINGNGSSCTLERVVRDLYRALAYTPHDINLHILLAKSYKRMYDYHSMMSCLAHILKLDPSNITGRRMIFAGFMTRGQEYMCWASAEAHDDHPRSQDLWKKAIASYESASAIRRDSVRLWLHLAICYINIKEYKKALQSVTNCLRDIKEDHSRNIDMLTLRAKLFWALGYIDHGNKEIRQVAKIAPEHVEVLAFTARCYHAAENYYKFAIREFSNKNYNDALHYTRIAIKITEDDIKLYILLSKIYRVMNNLDDAYIFISKAQDLYSDQITGNKSHYNRQQERQEQSNGLGSMLILSPSSSMFRTKFSSVIRSKFNSSDNQGNTDKTQSSDSGINKKNIDYEMEVPDEIIRQTNLIFNELAISYAIKGDYNKAIVIFNKVIQSSVELCERYKSYNIGRRVSISHPLLSNRPHYQTTRMTNALKNLFAFSYENRSLDDENYYKYVIDSKYYLNRGDCYRALENYVSAYKDYQTALALTNSDHQDVWLIQTRLSMIHYIYTIQYYNQCDYNQAENEISKAIEFNPKISEYYSLRGKIRYYLSNYIGASNDFKHCLELNPDAIDIAMKLEQFDAGGTHSIKQLQYKLPQKIINLINKSEQQMQMLNNRHNRKKKKIIGVDELECIDEEENDSYLYSKSNNQSRQSQRSVNITDSIPGSRETTRRRNYRQTLSHSITLPAIKSPLESNISTKYVPVLLQSNEYRKSKAAVKKVITDKLDTSKDGTLWPLLNIAKDLAIERRGDLKDDAIVSSLPASSVGIKQSVHQHQRADLSNPIKTKEMAKGLSRADLEHPKKKFNGLKLLRNKKIRKYRRKSSITSTHDSDDNAAVVDDAMIDLEYKRRYQTLTEGDMNQHYIYDKEEDIRGDRRRNDDQVADGWDDVSTIGMEDSKISSHSDTNDKKFNQKSKHDKIKINRWNGGGQPYDNYDEIHDDGASHSSGDTLDAISNLMKSKYASRIATMLENVGDEDEWDIKKSSVIDSSTSTLLLSEEDELRVGYEKEQIEVENKLISQRIKELKEEKEHENQKKVIEQEKAERELARLRKVKSGVIRNYKLSDDIESSN